MLYGGFGSVASGRSQFGSAESDVEPRSNRASDPSDGAHNVASTKWLTYEVYYYSSTPPLTAAEGLLIEVSEDAGATFTDATGAPYDLTVRVKDGQTLWIKILRTGLWPNNSEIVIRTTAPDEFGNPVTDTYPVRWP